MCIPSNFQYRNGKKWLCEAFLHVKRIGESTCSKSEDAVTKGTCLLLELTYLNYQSMVFFLRGMWLPFSNDCLWNYRICLSQRTSEDWNEIALKLSYWSLSFIRNFYPYIILGKFEKVGRGMHEKRNTRCMCNNHVNAHGKSPVNKKNKCVTAYGRDPFEFVGWNANDFYKEW